MKIPQRYEEIRQSLPDEVSFGCGGIALFPLGKIESAQVGYSVKADGTSLCTGKDGGWQPAWLVIGQETACGDPIFIDTDNAALPVYTTMHGVGAWQPNDVAGSAEIFAACLKELSHVAAGRGSPGELERNPLEDDERQQFLNRIADLNRSATAPEFWDLQLSC